MGIMFRKKIKLGCLGLSALSNLELDKITKSHQYDDSTRNSALKFLADRIGYSFEIIQ